MYAVILQCADYFQSGAIAHVRQPWVFVTAEVSLQNSPVFCAIEHGTPGFEFAHTIGGFLRVQFGHAPLVDILTAAHGIGKMHFPIVAIINIGQRCCDAAFRHHGVRFA